MENKISFYAILPSFVRYDKDLSSTSKLIYAEITALCNSKGFCWASNSYFSHLFNISDRQVRNILKILVDKNYIFVKIENNTNRKIFLNVIDTPEKNFLPPGSNFPGRVEENFLHNNKMNNKINNNNKDFEDLLNYDWINE